MKNKGFTLIELLAVIVILAIIALIATPIILGIINDSKKQSEDRSAELYLDAAKKAIASYQMSHSDADFSGIKNCSIENGVINCGNEFDPIEVKVDGTHPIGGTIVLSDGNVSDGTSIVYGEDKAYNYTNGRLVLGSAPAASQGFTGTIYRNSDEKIKNGETIASGTKSAWCGIIPDYGTSCDYGYSWSSNDECVTQMAETLYLPGSECEEGTVSTGLTSYETEETKNNITQDYYLKHDVVNDIVIASYACIRYTEDNVQKEACVEGYNPDVYGTFDGINNAYSTSDLTNASGNIAEIYSTRDYFASNSGQCSFSRWYSNCQIKNVLGLYADPYGQVRSDTGEGGSDCTIYDEDGVSYCQ